MTNLILKTAEIVDDRKGSTTLGKIVRRDKNGINYKLVEFSEAKTVETPFFHNFGT